MTGAELREGVIALEEEIGRLERLKERIGGVTAGDATPGAQVGERLHYTLEIACRALERDAARLQTLARFQSAG